MAEEKRSTANLAQRHSANTIDRFVMLSDPTGNGVATVTVSLNDIFSNSVLNVVANSIAISTPTTPANSTSLAVRAGTLLYDANYLYVATADNVIKRIGTLAIF